MPNKKNIPKGYVKNETMFFTAIIALGIGFFGGIIYSSCESSSGHKPVNSTQKQLPKKEFNQGEKPSFNDNILKFEKKVELNPRDTDAWTQLGNLYFDTKQYDKAIFSYEKSLELKPGNPDVLTDLGVMYRRSGKYDKAISAFNRAINIDPNHEIARINKGIVFLHDLKNRREAVKAWEDLLKVNPSAKTASGQPIAELVKTLKKSNDRP